MFNIGDQVICINSSMSTHTIEELSKDVPNWVTQDTKYTVRGFNENDGIVLGVLLEEIVNPLRYFKLVNKFQEPAFRTDRFRKLKPNEVTASIEEYQMVE
jgi:hypothetical protein